MYNELMLLFKAAYKIVPDRIDTWKALSMKTKSRYIEIYKCIKAGTPVPSMPMTNSMIGHGSSSFAPSNMHNSNFPAAPSNPNFPAAPSNPNFPAAPSNPNFPAAPNNPLFSSSPSNPNFPAAPSNPNFPAAPSNPLFSSSPNNPNFFSDPSIPPLPSVPSVPSFPQNNLGGPSLSSVPSNPSLPSAPSIPSLPQNNLGSPSLPPLPSNPNFPGSVPSFQMGNQERSNSGYSGFGEPSNFYNVAHSEIPMHPDEAQPGLRRSGSANRDNSSGQTQFEDVQLPGANRNTWGKPSSLPANGGHQMGVQTNFSNGGHQMGVQNDYSSNGGHQMGVQNDYSSNGGHQMGVQTNFGNGGHQMGMQNDMNSNGGNQMGNFGGNRMPSYGENRQQFGMGGNGQPMPAMNYMQDFGGQTTVIQSGLKNRQTGVGIAREIEK